MTPLEAALLTLMTQLGGHGPPTSRGTAIVEVRRALEARAELPAMGPSLPSTAADRASITPRVVRAQQDVKQTADKKAQSRAQKLADDDLSRLHDNLANQAAQGTAASEAKNANADSHAAAGQSRAAAARAKHGNNANGPGNGVGNGNGNGNGKAKP